jgi:hypothetical protein
MVGAPTGGSAVEAASPVSLDQYGRGDYDEETGIWEWYEIPDAEIQRLETQANGVTWDALLTHWSAIEADLQDRGIDVDDTTLMASRSWRWLRVRITGLLADRTTRISQALSTPTGRS